MMSKWKLDLHTAVREPTSPHLLNLSAGIVKHLPRWTLSLVVMYNLSEAPFLVPLGLCSGEAEGVNASSTGQDGYGCYSNDRSWSILANLRLADALANDSMRVVDTQVPSRQISRGKARRPTASGKDGVKSGSEREYVTLHVIQYLHGRTR